MLIIHLRYSKNSFGGMNIHLPVWSSPRSDAPCRNASPGPTDDPSPSGDDATCRQFNPITLILNTA